MKRGFRKLTDFPLDQKDQADALALLLTRLGLRNYSTVQRRGQIWIWVYTVHLGTAERALAEFRDDQVARSRRLGLSLVGKRVLFLHQPVGVVPAVVMSCDPDGMVELMGWSGKFAPHLFQVVEEAQS